MLETYFGEAIWSWSSLFAILKVFLNTNPDKQ